MSELVLDEDGWPEYSIAVADIDSGVTISGERVPFVKWGKSWAVPGCEGDECNTLEDIVYQHRNVRVLKPGAIEWIRVSSY